MLRSRQLDSRADWVDKQLPALIDTFQNAALLRTLGIDAAAMSHEFSPESAEFSPGSDPLAHSRG